jgi:catechol 2,3-dioxygenase-like lactoylglutathione lyase family enzyme
MGIQFGMVVLYARDLERTIAFYRLLGLEVPDPFPDRPVSLLRTGSGVSFVFTTERTARLFDPAWVRPEGGYQQVLEFVVDDDAAVDAAWAALTAAGHHGRTPPGAPNGIYSAMVDDPDGNVLLISSDPAARPVRR